MAQKRAPSPQKHGSSQQVMQLMHQLFQNEMAGIIRYLHYSFMIMGHNRIPIQKWFRMQATESMNHATLVGEKITSLGGHPPVLSAQIEETNLHSVDQILRECLVHEERNLGLYRQLVKLAGSDIALEELARDFVRTETEHVDEVKKMLRSP
jgi:bacterioferritin